MTSAWPEPQVKPVQRVSPTFLNAMEPCLKRAAFRLDPDTAAWDRPSTRTALGVAAHAVTEAVEAGHYDASAPINTWLEGAWEDAIATQRRRLEAAWPGRVIPAERAWPGYAHTKVRLLRRLARRLEGASASSPGDLAVRTHPSAAAEAPSHHDGLDSLPWVERRLEDPESGVFGTPDRVELRGSEVWLVDLKAGVHQGEMTDSQRRQLLIYAHLVEARLGRLPDRACIQDVRGRELSFAVAAQEALETISEVRSTIREFNRLASAGGISTSPSPEACGPCPYRVVCQDYWETSQADWRFRGDIEGEVVSVDEHGWHVRDAPDSPTRRLVPPADLHAKQGNRVVAVGCAVVGPNVLHSLWNSRIRVV